MPTERSGGLGLNKLALEQILRALPASAKIGTSIDPSTKVDVSVFLRMVGEYPGDIIPIEEMRDYYVIHLEPVDVSHRNPAKWIVVSSESPLFKDLGQQSEVCERETWTPIDTQKLARRHGVPCRTCDGTGWNSASRRECSPCDGAGLVGNCPDCHGNGASDRGLERPPLGCAKCQTKGWIGGCPACLGMGIVEEGDAYRACVTCRGYGHLETDLRESESPRFAIIASNSSECHRIACGKSSLRFGRWRRPHADVDVRLLNDPHIAKTHCEVYWNRELGRHFIRNLGATFLPSLNGKPVDHEGRQLSAGDVISIGAWTLVYVELVVTAQNDSEGLR